MCHAIARLEGSAQMASQQPQLSNQGPPSPTFPSIGLSTLEIWRSTLPFSWVPRAFREKSYTVKSTGRFAVLNVGAVKAVIAEAHERLLSIDHKKEPDDPSHAGITGYGSEDLAIAAELSALLASDDIYSVPDITRPV